MPSGTRSCPSTCCWRRSTRCARSAATRCSRSASASRPARSRLRTWTGCAAVRAGWWTSGRPSSTWSSCSARTPPDGIAGAVLYRADLFDHATVERLTAVFLRVLDQVLVDPDVPVSEVEVLGPDERRRVTEDWNATGPGMTGCLGTLVERQARVRPGALALVYEQEELTYGELNVRANRLARHLAAAGAGARDRGRGPAGAGDRLRGGAAGGGQDRRRLRGAGPGVPRRADPVGPGPVAGRCWRSRRPPWPPGPAESARWST